MGMYEISLLIYLYKIYWEVRFRDWEAIQGLCSLLKNDIYYIFKEEILIIHIKGLVEKVKNRHEVYDSFSIEF